ncbi:MAG: tungsten ABC transporter substrate-binding protein [Actinobacteria bacterium]|nr:MAG: tungsten ABC transporter substrate-binding protein [Actinomycetota bacterium]
MYKPASAGTYYARAKFDDGTSRVLTLVVKPKIKVILASTTSTQDSGLFGVLVPAFERAYPKYDLQVVAVGSGAAMEMGKRDDADVLLVHSPAAEKAFVADGYGMNRLAVMHNDFLLVGPSADPAKVKSVGDIVACFKQMYSQGDKFVSRGDKSGTNVKELALWSAAGVNPAGKSWYIVMEGADRGMGAALRLSAEKDAYTIVDRATWVTNPQSGLVTMQQGDDVLKNPYSVIEVIGARQPAGAAAFSTWIRSRVGQAVIENYVIRGQRLFLPDVY